MPEPDVYRVRRLYDVLADIVQPDGTLLARAGDVVNETVRERIGVVVGGSLDWLLRPVDRDIPIDGSVDVGSMDAALGVDIDEWWEMHGFQCQQFDND
jgi:hypothetical protein